MHFITQSHGLAALGASLVNSLWQMAMVWLVYIALTSMFKRISSHAKHALAIACLSLGSGWFLVDLIRAFANPGNPATGLAHFLADPANRLAQALHAGRIWLDAALPYLSFVYLGAVFYMMLRHLLYYRRLSAIRKKGLHKIQPRLKLFTRITAAHMGIRKKVMVWLSEAVDTPVTIGFLKPIILVPLATVNHLTTEQVEAILLHELSHIRRNDYLINLFLTWTGIVFFFNPFSRLLIHHIRREREHCCDDLVMQFQYNPRDYASALLSLEKKRQYTSILAMAAIGRSQPLLLERIKRLTGQPVSARRYSLALFSFFLLSMILALGTVIRQKEFPATSIARINRPPGAIPPEVSTVNYLTAAAAPGEKEKKISRKNKKPERPEWTAEDEETNLAFVSNPDGDIIEDNTLAAVHAEKRDFSIMTTVDPVVAPAASVDENLPYVPKTSYSYQVQVDSIPQIIVEDKEARTSMEKTIQVVKQLNWKKIEKQISSEKQVNARDLQNQIQQSLRELDWQKINAQSDKLLSEADEKRLRESIDVQVDAYNDIKLKDPERARNLQRKIRQAQLRLRQDQLKKQLESIQREQEQIRKTAKVVYI